MIREARTTGKVLLMALAVGATFATAAKGRAAGGLSDACANTFLRSCNDTDTNAGFLRCCAGVAVMYDNNTSCLCSVFAAANLTDENTLTFLHGCNISTTPGSSPCSAATAPAPSPLFSPAPVAYGFPPPSEPTPLPSSAPAAPPAVKSSPPAEGVIPPSSPAEGRGPSPQVPSSPLALGPAPTEAPPPSGNPSAAAESNHAQRITFIEMSSGLMPFIFFCLFVNA